MKGFPDKNSLFKVVLVILSFALFWFLVYFLNPKKEYNTIVNKSDVRFEGEVISFDNSGRLHGFGIIRLKLLKSNTKMFNAFQDGVVYPFNINGEDCEVYS
jgi:hypothetical protein